MKNAIRYLERKEIDENKWNACIHGAFNGLCYSDSAFLDAIATQWSALVMDDYQAVMPLISRRKFGIHYLYQPAFCQQTGIAVIDRQTDPTDLFLAAIPQKYKYWDIQLNAFNSTNNYSFTLRKNFLLDLNAPIVVLQSGYHRNVLRNLRKAKDRHIEVTEDISAEVLVNLHLSRFENKGNISHEEYKGLERLLGSWSSASKAKLIGARDAQGNIIASSGYVIYKNRITFILNGNSRESLNTGATHLLKDHLIRKYSGSGYLLDFEGSDNPNFARFYQQFGANTCEYYPRIICNRLRWPFRLVKSRPLS